MPDVRDSPPDGTTVANTGAQGRDGQFKFKVIKSLFLVQIWFSLGVNTAILTPSLIDLSEMLNVNIAQMSLGSFVAKSVGMLFGGPLGGTLSEKYRRHSDLLLALEVGLMCASTAVAPLTSKFAVAAALFAFSGFSGAALGATGNPMILDMWGKKAPLPLLFIHGGYGLGLTVTPIFTAPFLSKDITSNTTNQTPAVEGMGAFLGGAGNGTQPWVNLQTLSQIYIPFAVSGALGVIGAVGMLIFYCLGPPAGLQGSRIPESRSWGQVLHPTSYSPGRTGFGVAMAVGLFFMYIGIVGKDRTLNSFITTYAVQELNISKSTASDMTTAYFASYTLGRYISMLFSLCVPIYVTLFVCIICDLGAALALVLTGLHSPVRFWALTLLFGLFAGPVYPAGMAWADRYIEVTPVVVAIIDMGIIVGYLTCTWGGSQLYQYVNHVYVIQIVLYFSGFLLLTVTLLQWLGYSRGTRHHEEIQNNSQDARDAPDVQDVPDGQMTDHVDEYSPLIN